MVHPCRAARPQGVRAQAARVHPRSALRSVLSLASLPFLLAALLLLPLLGGCDESGEGNWPVWVGHDPTLTAADFGQRGPRANMGASAPSPGDVDLEPVPRALTAFPRDVSAEVRWWPVEGAEGYVLYRGLEAGSTPADADRIEVSETRWVDEDVPAGEMRWYAVAALVDGVEGRLSGEISIRGVEALRPRQFFVQMDPADLDRLYSRNRYNDDLLPAALFVTPENIGLETQGIRFRGAGSRRYPKFGFNIRLEGRPAFNFGGSGRRGGNRILLNAMWTDGSALRDAIAYDMYHAIDYPASQVYYSELYLNDIYEGFYVNFERIDRELLRRQGLEATPGRFTLVRDNMKSLRRQLDMEEIRTAYSLNLDEMYATEPERIEFLQWLFDWRGEMEDQDWVALLELVRWAYNAAPGEDFARGLEQRFDVDALIDFLAVHIIALDTDSMDQDYWLYRSADEGLWRWLPWDKNLVFGSGWYGDFLGSNDFFRYDRTLLPALNNQIVIKLFETGVLYDRLDARVRELMETTYTRPWMEARIEAWLPHVVRSMDRHGEPGTFERHGQQHHGEIGYMPQQQEVLAEFMERRRNWLLKELDRRRGRLSGTSDQGSVQDVRVRAGTRSCLVDRFGRTLACLRPDANWRGDWAVEVTRNARIDGVQRRWILRLSHGFEGTLTLYYANAPGRNWLDQEEDEEDWAGDQWRLDMVHTTRDAGARQLRTRVNPYANMAEAHVTLEGGVHSLTLPFGP